MSTLTLSDAPVDATRSAAEAERQVYAKIARRLMPILTVQLRPELSRSQQHRVCRFANEPGPRSDGDRVRGGRRRPVPRLLRLRDSEQPRALPVRRAPM